jgi:hypothetical protein
MHDVPPALGLCVPAAHRVHEEVPAALLKKPAKQGAHEALPTLGLNEPAVQGAHAAAVGASGEGLAVPSPQGVGAVAFAGQNAPAGQGTGS